MSFQINVKNSVGIFSKTIEATTDGSTVTVVPPVGAPTPTPIPVVISNVSITSSNADARYAVVGDIVTLTFHTTEHVTKLGNFKINGGNPTNFTSALVGTDYLNTATYTVDATDPDTFMNLQINVKNDAGIYSVTTEATTDGSNVHVLKAAIISNVHIESSNADVTKAVYGDMITLTFTTTEQVIKLGNFKIDGSNPSSFVSTQTGNVWTNTAQYMLDGTEAAGLVNFQINVKNVARLYSITTEATNDGSSVTISKAPNIKFVHIESNNADHTVAQIGNTVTLQFGTTEQMSGRLKPTVCA